MLNRFGCDGVAIERQALGALKESLSVVCGKKVVTFESSSDQFSDLMELLDTVTFLKSYEALEAIEQLVAPSFGPCGSHVLISTNTGQCLVSKDGKTITETCVASEPVKRWIKDRIKAYSKSSGDGSKSFVLIMSELLRRIKSHHSHRGDLSLKSFCLELVEPFTVLTRETIPSVVAKAIVSDSACVKTSLCDSDELWEFLIQLTFSVLQGNLAQETARLLSNLAIQFVKLPNPEFRLEEHISFVVNNFADFCQDVGGYSVTDSYITEGVLIQRDFAYRDSSLSNCDSDFNVVLVAYDFQIEEERQAATPCINLSSMEDVTLAATWNEANWRKLVNNLKSLNVAVIISVNIVPEPLMASCRLAGISVIHSVYLEDLEHITAQTRIPVNYEFLENLTWTTHKVSFLKRVVLGKKAFCCVGFRSVTGQILKHLILCGPSSAICRSYSLAIQNSLKTVMIMLNEAGFEFVISSQSQNCNRDQTIAVDDERGGQTNHKRLCAVYGGGAAEVLASNMLVDLSEKEEKELTRLAFVCFAESLDIIPKTLHSNSYHVNHKRYLEGKVGRADEFVQGIHASTGHWVPANDVGILEPLMHKVVLWQQVLGTLCDLFRIDSIIGVSSKVSLSNNGEENDD